MTELQIASLILALVFFVFVNAGSLLQLLQACRRPRPTWLNAVWKWTKWPSLVHVFSWPLIDVITDRVDTVSVVLYILNAILWWLLRNSGDDDLDDKLTEAVNKIKRRFNRLVVVPA